jgi:hypothetical protein
MKPHMTESIETLFLDSRTPKLAYDIRAGGGPVLLCVHGNSSHRGLWAPLPCGKSYGRLISRPFSFTTLFAALFDSRDSLRNS